MRKLKLIVLLTGALAFTSNGFANQQQEQEYDHLVSRFSLGEQFLDAAYCGYCHKFKDLLEKGVDVNYRNQEGRTALHMAAAGGNVGFIKLLLENGAELEACDMSGGTALHYAVACSTAKDHIYTVEFLIEKGANVNVLDKSGAHVLEFRSLPAVVNVLVDAGAKIEINEESVQESLKVAVFKKQIPQVRKFIEEGADVNFIPNYGSQHLLSYAARYKDTELLQILLDAGADVNLCDQYGHTALHWATSDNQMENVEFLLKAGADINAFIDRGVTPLHAAIRLNNFEMVKFLIEKGAKITYSHTRACTFDNEKMIEYIKANL